jgi:uncharacterized membrane protein
VNRSTLRDRIVFPVVAIVAIVVIWSLPDFHPDPSAIGFAPVEAARGVVLAVEPMQLDPDDPFAEVEGEVLVRVTEGPRSGDDLRAFVALPYTQARAEDFSPGDEVIVTFTDQPQGGAFVAISERWRLPIVALFIVVFVVTIMAVGGWQGMRALLALALTVVVVVKILVPAILEGVPPVPLSIGIAGAVTIATILLTEGLDRVSLAAILGTIGGLAATAILSAVVGAAAAFSGSQAGELALVQVTPGEALDTRGLLLAAIIIGAVGVLDDMTVTQAATVGQLVARSGLRARALWRSAMHVGRAHIAATVNTLFMAYVGAALPGIVFLAVSAEPTLLTLNREVLALEVVRTLAGSLGIVLAMPLTTVIAIALIGRRSVGSTPAGVGDVPLVPGPMPAPIGGYQGVRPRALPTSRDHVERR